MAKMKVHELAKELGVESKEILAELKNKGIEVKSHMSVLEDEQVENLKNAMKAPGKSAETSKASEKKESLATEIRDEDKKPEKATEAPVKKKKSIIVVSNPSNSKMPGGSQVPKKPAKPAAPKFWQRQSTVKIPRTAIPVIAVRLAEPLIPAAVWMCWRSMLPLTTVWTMSATCGMMRFTHLPR